MHLAIWHLIIPLCLMSTLEVPCCGAEGGLHFIQAPQNKTVQLDHHFRYRCRVSGPNDYVIKWFHDGAEMARRGQNYRISMNGTLRFSKVKVVDRGWYYCRVGNSFMGTIESSPAYLTVHAPAVIIKKYMISRPREEPVGSVIHLTCGAAGIPPPVIEWRKNGNLIMKNHSNPLEVQTEYDTSPVSLTSTLKIVVSQSATYSCCAVNFPVKKLFNDSVIINIRAIQIQGEVAILSLAVVTFPDSTGQVHIFVLGSTGELQYREEFFIEKDVQLCVPYTGTICQDYLQSRVVLHNGSQSIQQRDAALEAQLRDISDLGLFSEDMGGLLCEGPARRLLCHMAFPDCNNETNQAVRICRESCQAVKSVICFHHLAELEDMKHAGKVLQDIGLLSLPDCLTLPSKWDSTQMCLESDHHDFSPFKVRDDCYTEKGRWYNGTVSSTKSGHTCQAWVDNFPHKHDRSPLIFPELLGAENFCRNPGGEESQPWCYTTYAERRWEICDISSCDLGGELDVNNSLDDRDYERDDEEDLTLLYIIGPCALVTVISFVVAILCFLLRCRHGAEYSATSVEEVDINVESLPLNSAYHQMKSNRLNLKLEALEFPRNDIVFIEDIGQGAFGRVFKARLVSGNSIPHISWGKLSSSKHSLNYDKKSKHRNPFSSMGDLGSIEIHASSKSCDSKLLAEQLSMLYDHDKDMKNMEGQLIAIKMLKEDASDIVQADFEREASLMVEFDHVNIVRLLGVCTLGKPMCLLFEYMSKGDLNEYLRLCSPDQCLRQSNAGSNPSLIDSSSISTLDQLHMARQIANGMVYLSDRGYVHRDLATRNCLVGNNLIVKISDFGLARSVHSMDYYHGSDKDAIPVRWMPPEAILYNKFSSQSDVWSFGILLWEIFSFAVQPYYGMTHEEVVIYLREGNILDAPDYGPSAAYELMKSCWHRKPLSRPSFVSLHKSLNIMYEETTKLKLIHEGGAGCTYLGLR